MQLHTRQEAHADAAEDLAEKEAADLVAQRALAPAQIPVGLVTGAFGGLYLAGLLLAERRMGRGT